MYSPEATPEQVYNNNDLEGVRKVANQLGFVFKAMDQIAATQDDNNHIETGNEIHPSWGSLPGFKSITLEGGIPKELTDGIGNINVKKVNALLRGARITLAVSSNRKDLEKIALTFNELARQANPYIALDVENLAGEAVLKLSYDENNKERVIGFQPEKTQQPASSSWGKKIYSSIAGVFFGNKAA
jgi:hypothetical protein